MTRLSSVPPTLAIVGGGFSGAAAALHFAREATRPLRIVVIEPRAQLGGGVAHGNPEPVLRLNATDALHSPYPESPSAFADWLRLEEELAHDAEAVEASGLVFARRHALGRFMAAELAKHSKHNASGSTIEHLPHTATGLRCADTSYAVELSGGGVLAADKVLVALGWNAPAVPPELQALHDHDRWLPDPWETTRLNNIPRQARVLLVGAGLTASDLVAALRARGHSGPLMVLSRRGLRPATQNPFRSSSPIWERVFKDQPSFIQTYGFPAGPREALRALRKAMAKVDPLHSSWHTPFDELRDAVPQFWPRWTETEQKRYLRHLKVWYDAFRFRNPPQIERVLKAAEAEGQLVFHAGRLREVNAVGHYFKVHYQPRAGGELAALDADVIINCTGPQLRPSTSTNPFWRQIIRDGLGRDHALGLGIDVDARGHLLRADGTAHDGVAAVGPPTLGRFGECTAVPFIVKGILSVLDSWYPLPDGGLRTTLPA